MTATTAGDYAIFAGGWGDSGASNVVDIFIPEPSTALLLGLGMLAAMRRRPRRDRHDRLA
ncbi:MAG: PEP-CTERM sorting domain-containing protein [Hyphomicrobiales bacterium]|nr:MAG: PEP-CTERM sorting domain-containing protein [Hyphomicrobiales bacterium]